MKVELEERKKSIAAKTPLRVDIATLNSEELKTGVKKKGLPDFESDAEGRNWTPQPQKVSLWEE